MPANEALKDCVEVPAVAYDPREVWEPTAPGLLPGHYRCVTGRGFADIPLSAEEAWYLLCESAKRWGLETADARLRYTNRIWCADGCLYVLRTPPAPFCED